jgi:anti-anti-sigma factor
MSDQTSSNGVPRPDAPRTWLDVATSGPHLVIRLGGLGNMFAAMMLRDLVYDWTSSGCRYLLLDLQRCEGLDSTFMGTLVNLGEQLRDRGGVLRLYNVPQHCRDQLAILGADSLLDIAGEGPVFPQMEFTRLEPPPDDPRRRAELVREAHTCLCGLSEANRQLFGDYLRMLDSDLNRGKGDDSAGASSSESEPEE